MQARPIWLGPALALIAAASFATGTTIAVIAYDAGATPLSVITTRITFTVFALIVLMRVTGSAFGLPPRERNIALALGLLLGIQSYCHYEAIGILPVAIAILVFYLFPLLVGVISHFTGEERMSPALGIALAVAALGLFFALNVTGGGLNMSGILLALGAAVSFSVVVVINASLIRRTGRSLPVTLHMNLTAALAFVVTCAVLGEFPLPDGREGWIAFTAVPVFYSIGMICFFVAVGAIGAVWASLLMNLEPVAAIVLGLVLLGQVLMPLQLLGAGLVVAAIIAGRWHTVRAARTN